MLLVACGSSDSADESTAAPRALDEQLVGFGESIYATSCAACHGANGEGASDWRVPDAQGALPPPPHDSNGHTWHHSDGLLYRIIRDGCAAYGMGTSGCNMPAFGDELGDDGIRAVIEFMRGWWGPEDRLFQEEITRNDPFP